MITLYKRNNYGEPIFWSIDKRINSIYIVYGIVGKSERSETVNASDPDRDIISRTNQKRKDGYKLIDELHDNAPTIIVDINIRMMALLFGNWRYFIHKIYCLQEVFEFKSQRNGL